MAVQQEEQICCSFLGVKFASVLSNVLFYVINHQVDSPIFIYIELYLGQILPLCIIILCVLSKHLLLWFHISLATFICIFVDLHLWEPGDWPRWEIEGGAEEVSTNGRSAARVSRNKTTTVTGLTCARELLIRHAKHLWVRPQRWQTV